MYTNYNIDVRINNMRYGLIHTMSKRVSTNENVTLITDRSDGHSVHAVSTAQQKSFEAFNLSRGYY